MVLSVLILLNTWYSNLFLYTEATTEATEDTLSDCEEDPLVVRSSEDVEVEDEYYEDDLGASHGDQDVPSEDLTEESDTERNPLTNTKSWSTKQLYDIRAC